MKAEQHKYAELINFGYKIGEKSTAILQAKYLIKNCNANNAFNEELYIFKLINFIFGIAIHNKMSIPSILGDFLVDDIDNPVKEKMLFALKMGIYNGLSTTK